MKCQIQWVDRQTGLPTPDDNEAVCVAVTTIIYRDGSKTVRVYPCCRMHQKELRDMTIQGPERALDPYNHQLLYTSQWEEEPMSILDTEDTN